MNNAAAGARANHSLMLAGTGARVGTAAAVLMTLATRVWLMSPVQEALARDVPHPNAVRLTLQLAKRLTDTR